MGWFWGSSSSKPSPTVQRLDPDLREFLEREKPAAQPPISSEPKKSSIDTLYPPAPSSQPSPENAAPKESLFPDGRYADIWKTYRALADIESATKTDQEMLTDLVDAYKDRQAALKSAAQENCIFEQLAYRECLESRGWFSQMTSCHDKNRRFFRCYEMQGKFLKALGYMSQVGRDEEKCERIQMHADKLYRRMIEQEELRKKAEAEGKDVGDLIPVMAREKVGGLMEPSPHYRSVETVLEKLSPEDREPFLERLRNKSPEQRALEERLIEGEIKDHIQHALDLGAYYKEERIHREQRKAEGRQTFGDRLKSWTGWDKPMQEPRERDDGSPQN